MSARSQGAHDSRYHAHVTLYPRTERQQAGLQLETWTNEEALTPSYFLILPLFYVATIIWNLHLPPPEASRSFFAAPSASFVKLSRVLWEGTQS